MIIAVFVRLSLGEAHCPQPESQQNSRVVYMYNDDTDYMVCLFSYRWTPLQGVIEESRQLSVNVLKFFLIFFVFEVCTGCGKSMKHIRVVL